MVSLGYIVRRAWCELPHITASHCRIRWSFQNQLLGLLEDFPIVVSVFGVNLASCCKMFMAICHVTAIASGENGQINFKIFINLFIIRIRLNVKH